MAAPKKLIVLTVLVFMLTFLSVCVESTNSLLSQNNLECFCDVCKETNFMCVTNGFCFISRETVNGSFQVSQRCYSSNQHSHFAFPSICTKFYDDKYQVQCCSNDLCNEEDILPPRITEISTEASTELQAKRTIKCHCSHCSSTQFLCETDGLCFLSWRKINDEFVYTQSCYDKKLFFPPDAPDFCETRSFDDYGRMCCTKDYCNIEEFREEARFNMYALIFFVAFLLSIVFLVYQNWN